MKPHYGKQRCAVMDRTILVNGENPVPAGYLASIEMVAVKVDEGFSVPLERETAESYLEMRRYLLSIRIHVEVVSGYRSRETLRRRRKETGRIVILERLGG